MTMAVAMAMVITRTNFLSDRMKGCLASLQNAVIRDDDGKYGADGNDDNDDGSVLASCNDGDSNHPVTNFLSDRMKGCLTSLQLLAKCCNAVICNAV